MNKVLMFGAAVMFVMPGVARAQLTKTVPGEMKTATVTIEAIERSTREVTVKKPDGTYDVFYASDALKQFDNLKVGDTINARYYENIVLQLKAPGEKDVDTNDRQITRAEGTSGGTAAHQRTITATITAIDPQTPSITFSGPRGWTYSTRVKDRDALAKVKIGDKVDITWTTALLLSLDQTK